jgi:hypothetical protein
MQASPIARADEPLMAEVFDRAYHDFNQTIGGQNIFCFEVWPRSSFVFAVIHRDTEAVLNRKTWRLMKSDGRTPRK